MPWSSTPEPPPTPGRTAWAPGDGHQPTPTAPRTGWWPVAIVAGTGTSIGDAAGRAAVRASGTGTSVGDAAAAILVHLAGTGGSIGDAAAAVLAHLAGTGTSVGDSGGRGAIRATGAGTSVGDAAAAVLAHLSGAGTGVGSSYATVLAHLTGTGTSVGNGAATAGFAPHAPERTEFTAAGAYTYLIPGWCRFIDQVLMPGGASGQTGDGAFSGTGKGGNPGVYLVRTLERGVDLPWTQTTITGTVGAGGARPANSDNAAPNPGGATTADWGSGNVTAPGPTGTQPSGQNGGSSAAVTVNGQNYPAGPGGTGNAGAGSAPGGAGAGGNGGIFGSRTQGGPGGTGRASFYARQS
ncbi:hypothetical protein FK529_05425 [Tsukamurella asaccharolytica]|uniref:Glycine-rich domain-containing protein n=1 Tax=Tsukamurella asaccharolytica TaxID=2592067 RepID=A0A5C5RCX1_9ACTN|nr:hypothetical protein [Tsukamurella asaccharolytica]TWS20770.1 hypothetical protein FK529_05425 [Tsukamurella asaccharolytica]